MSAVIRIGFVQPVYIVDESVSFVHVSLAKEGNTTTEQTFSVGIAASQVSVDSILPAVQSIGGENGDFAFANGSAAFYFHLTPLVQAVSVNVTLFDDIVAEGTEAFQLEFSRVRGAPYHHPPVKSFADTRIIIEDNDGV